MAESIHKPKLGELGKDLLAISFAQKCLALILPFVLVGSFFYFVGAGYIYIPILLLIALSYFSYSSVSHDLVHGTYRLPRLANRILLSLIELLCLRSGSVYRVVHLNHHRTFPSHEDIEGKAAHLNCIHALLVGVLFQPTTIYYALVHKPKERPYIIAELILIAAIWLAAVIFFNSYPALLLYCTTLHMGSWLIPFMTSYFPHRANEIEACQQTRRFRGKVASILALDHLYHLEHHLYPNIPHQNWPKLARRLDGYLDKKKSKAIRFFR